MNQDQLYGLQVMIVFVLFACAAYKVGREYMIVKWISAIWAVAAAATLLGLLSLIIVR